MSNFVDEIIQNSREIIELLDYENRLIEEMRTKEMQNIQEQKYNLIRKFEENKKFIKENQELIMSLDEEKKKSLKEIAINLENSLTQNVNKLIIANEFNSMMLDFIENAISVRANTTYDHNGKIDKSKKSNPVKLKDEV